MPVYVIGPAKGAVKIGYSADPRRRLQKMQSDSPVDLGLLAEIAGGVGLEAELHARFASARVRGEWFGRTPAIEALIEAHAPPPPPPPAEAIDLDALSARAMRGASPAEIGRRLRAVRKDARLSATEVCRQLGFALPSYSMWESGQRRPRVDHMARFAERFDVTLEWLYRGRADATDGVPAGPAVELLPWGTLDVFAPAALFPWGTLDVFAPDGRAA